MRPEGRATRLWPALVAICGIYLALSIVNATWINDDAFVSFRYARSLAQGGGLAFNFEERAEGFSNFLWTIILSGLSLLGLDLPTAAKGLGLALGVASILALYRLGRRISPKPSALDLLAPALLATDLAFVHWSQSGLETSLYIFLVLVSLNRYLAEAGVLPFPTFPFLMAMAALTRLEGLVLFVATLIHGLVAKRAGRPLRHHIGVWIAIFLILFLPLALLLRLNYYNEILPNALLVKMEPGLMRNLGSGLIYLGGYIIDHRWYLLGLVLLPLLRPLRSEMALLALVVTLMALAVAVAGGDWIGQPFYRLILPAAPLLYLLVQEGTRRTAERLGPRLGGARAVAAGLCVVLLGINGLGREQRIHAFWPPDVPVSRWALADLIDRPGRLHDQIEQFTSPQPGIYGALARWLAQRYPSTTLIATDQIGQIPFYTGFRVLDLTGLISNDIAKGMHPKTAIFRLKPNLVALRFLTPLGTLQPNLINSREFQGLYDLEALVCARNKAPRMLIFKRRLVPFRPRRIIDYSRRETVRTLLRLDDQVLQYGRDME